MNDTNNDTDDVSREFVRELFSKSNKIQIDNQGISAENLNTLFNNND